MPQTLIFIEEPEWLKNMNELPMPPVPDELPPPVTSFPLTPAQPSFELLMAAYASTVSHRDEQTADLRRQLAEAEQVVADIKEQIDELAAPLNMTLKNLFDGVKAASDKFFEAQKKKSIELFGFTVSYRSGYPKRIGPGVDALMTLAKANPSWGLDRLIKTEWVEPAVTIKSK